MTRHDISIPAPRRNPAYEAKLLRLLRGIYENFGPWVSLVDGDLRVEWPKDLRSWTMPEARLDHHYRTALRDRGYIDEWNEGGTTFGARTANYRITVDGLIAIGAYPMELIGQTHDNQAEENSGEERKEAKQKTGFVKAEDLYPSF